MGRNNKRAQKRSGFHSQTDGGLEIERKNQQLRGKEYVRAGLISFFLQLLFLVDG
jgi:hypothetical protein